MYDRLSSELIHFSMDTATISNVRQYSIPDAQRILESIQTSLDEMDEKFTAEQVVSCGDIISGLTEDRDKLQVSIAFANTKLGHDERQAIMSSEKLASLLPSNTVAVVESIVDFWRLCDEVLSELCLESDDDRAVFKLSQPTPLFTQQRRDEWIYKAHVVELAERVLTESDTILPTPAEILCLMSDLSLKSPFRPEGMLLYCESFRSCARHVGVDYSEFADDDYIAAQVKSYGVLRDDLVRDVQSRMRQPWRQVASVGGAVSVTCDAAASEVDETVVLQRELDKLQNQLAARHV